MSLPLAVEWVTTRNKKRRWIVA